MRLAFTSPIDSDRPRSVLLLVERTAPSEWLADAPAWRATAEPWMCSWPLCVNRPRRRRRCSASCFNGAANECRVPIPPPQPTHSERVSVAVCRRLRPSGGTWLQERDTGGNQNSRDERQGERRRSPIQIKFFIFGNFPPAGKGPSSPLVLFQCHYHSRECTHTTRRMSATMRRRRRRSWGGLGQDRNWNRPQQSANKQTVRHPMKRTLGLMKLIIPRAAPTLGHVNPE